MSQIKFMLLALLFIGCMTSETSSENSPTSKPIDYVNFEPMTTRPVYGRTSLMAGDYRITSGRLNHYIKLILFDFSACTIENECLKLLYGTNYAITKNDSGIYIRDTIYDSRVKVSPLAGIWGKNRVPQEFDYEQPKDSLSRAKFLMVFDETPKCLSVETPSVSENGGQLTPTRPDVPCMPYLYLSEIPE